MQRLRSRLGAWWLLLLLGRVMAPEAAVLSLHAHHHTVDEEIRPAVCKEATDSHAKVSSRHQHCHTEQLYNAPFQPTLPPVVPLPCVQPVYPTHHALTAPCPARHLLPGTALRGPPVA